jgi:hypothetical protein
VHYWRKHFFDLLKLLCKPAVVNDFDHHFFCVASFGMLGPQLACPLVAVAHLLQCWSQLRKAVCHDDVCFGT